jgi:hypothetical protein
VSRVMGPAPQPPENQQLRNFWYSTPSERSDWRIKEKLPLEVQVGPLGVFLEDTEKATKSFRFQTAFVESTEIDFPCLDVDPVPIPLSLGLEHFAEENDVHGAQEAFDAAKRKTRLREMREIWRGSKVGHYSVQEAILFFRHRLKEFFGVRIDALELFVKTTGSPPGSSKGRPGLKFSVETDSNGLRAYYSPAYWMQDQRVLSFPTSPAKGWILPGRYYFGAGEPGALPIFDTSAYYDVPPDKTAHVPL